MCYFVTYRDLQNLEMPSGERRINEGERGGSGKWGQGGGGSVSENCSLFSYYKNWGHHRINFMNEFQRTHKGE